jgi:hypothetical protein
MPVTLLRTPWGRAGASPSYGVVKPYPECFSNFSCFVGQRSCQEFGLENELGYDRWDVSSCGSCPEARVGQGSLLSGMSGLTAQDALYASLKRNERAQSTNGL